MTKEEYKEMCRSHSLTIISDTKAVCSERGYQSVVQYAGKKTVSLSLPTGKDDDKTYKNELKAKLKENFGKNASAAWGDGYVTIFLDSKKIPDIYCQGVIPALDTLKGIGFTVPDRCSVCGGSGCDVAIPRGAAYAPVHRSCLEKGVTGAQEKADKNIEQGSYLLGALGALLGVIVGIIPSMLTIIAAERIYVYLFAVIPICSYFGYKLLRGKMTKVALVFTIVFSILGVYLLNFIVNLYYIADYYEIGVGTALGLLPYMIADPEMWLEITKTSDFLLCLVFVALGFFLTWGRISRTAKSDVKDASELLGSAIPYSFGTTQSFAYDPADYIPDAPAGDADGEEASNNSPEE